MIDTSGNQRRQVAADGFVWTETPIGRTLSCSTLSAFAEHLFTTRHLQFRDNSARRDYDQLARVLGAEPAALVRVRQVHGNEVLVLGRGDRPPVPNEVAADAIISTDPQLVPTVRIADCVPVLVADRRQRVVAAIHAGWRGTCAGVSAVTVRRIRDLGIEPESLVAAIGPSIGPCCYQVDRPVWTEFDRHRPDISRWFRSQGTDRWALDLWRANRDQLVEAGLPASSVWQADLCTAHNVDVCFSYRREGEKTGRMVAAVRLPG